MHADWAGASLAQFMSESILVDLFKKFRPKRVESGERASDDPLGLSIYAEVNAGDRLIELESKLIAQKNFGRWILDYNATLEAEWEDRHLEQETGEFQQALGASYEISPRFSVGVEFLHEFVFPDWSDTVTNVFVGPNVSYRRNQWFVTVTAVAQATDTEDESNFQLRTIFGIGF